MSDAAYINAFNQAVDKANRLNMDVGILRNSITRGYDVFLLPRPKNRSGHELRAQVVKPGTPKMAPRGLGGMLNPGGGGPFAPGGRAARSRSAPAWFTRALRQGALPHAEGEHGMWSAVSPNGRRVITNTDALPGQLYGVMGRTTRRGEFVEEREVGEMAEAAALTWLFGGARR